MTTLLPQSPFRIRISRVLLFGCALVLVTAVRPHEVLAQVTTTICKQTNPSPDPWGTSFKFVGANGWATPVTKTFSYLYPPNPFLLTDTQCRTFNITNNDKFNKFAENPVPPGWALTNIFCSYTKSVVNIIGSNPNPAFQPGDNTVTIDQADPNVTCTFVNTLACFVPTSLSLPPCARPGQTVSLDLSTTQIAGADPNWTVTPGGLPTHTNVAAWTALPPNNNWIKPTTNAASTYTYTRSFNLPCLPRDYQKLDLSGNFAADNNGRVFLNGNYLNQCTGSLCFQAPIGGTFFTAATASLFVPGLNQLTVIVGNQAGTPTGLAVVATLTATCGRDCVCGCPPGTVLQGGQCVRQKFPVEKKSRQPRKRHGSR
jgi:hypothetical protein